MEPIKELQQPSKLKGKGTTLGTRFGFGKPKGAENNTSEDFKPKDKNDKQHSKLGEPVVSSNSFKAIQQDGPMKQAKLSSTVPKSRFGFKPKPTNNDSMEVTSNRKNGNQGDKVGENCDVKTVSVGIKVHPEKNMSGTLKSKSQMVSSLANEESNQGSIQQKQESTINRSKFSKLASRFQSKSNVNPNPPKNSQNEEEISPKISQSSKLSTGSANKNAKPILSKLSKPCVNKKQGQNPFVRAPVVSNRSSANDSKSSPSGVASTSSFKNAKSSSQISKPLSQLGSSRSSQIEFSRSSSQLRAPISSSSQLKSQNSSSTRLQDAKSSSSQLQAPKSILSQLQALKSKSSQLQAPKSSSSQLQAQKSSSGQLQAPKSSSSHLQAPKSSSRQLPVPASSSSQLSGLQTAAAGIYLQKSCQLSDDKVSSDNSVENNSSEQLKENNNSSSLLPATNGQPEAESLTNSVNQVEVHDDELSAFNSHSIQHTESHSSQIASDVFSPSELSDFKTSEKLVFSTPSSDPGIEMAEPIHEVKTTHSTDEEIDPKAAKPLKNSSKSKKGSNKSAMMTVTNGKPRRTKPIEMYLSRLGSVVKSVRKSSSASSVSFNSEGTSPVEKNKYKITAEDELISEKENKQEFSAELDSVSRPPSQLMGMCPTTDSISDDFHVHFTNSSSHTLSHDSSAIVHFNNRPISPQSQTDQIPSGNILTLEENATESELLESSNHDDFVDWTSFHHVDEDVHNIKMDLVRLKQVLLRDMSTDSGIDSQSEESIEDAVNMNHTKLHSQQSFRESTTKENRELNKENLLLRQQLQEKEAMIQKLKETLKVSVLTYQ